jgi:hypothetical protein
MFLTTGVESSFRALIIVEATEFTDPRPTLERSALGNDGTTTFPELLEKMMMMRRMMNLQGWMVN